MSIDGGRGVEAGWYRWYSVYGSIQRSKKVQRNSRMKHPVDWVPNPKYEKKRTAGSSYTGIIKLVNISKQR